MDFLEMSTRKDGRQLVLKGRILVRNSIKDSGQSYGIWTFNDEVMTEDMMDWLSQKGVEEDCGHCEWLAQVFERIAYEVEGGNYPDDLEGLDLELLKEHLKMEVEADVFLLRKIESAYDVAFDFISWILARL